MSEQEIRMIPLAAIVREVEWYPRDRLSAERIADYASYYRDFGESVLPPISVGVIPGIDGFWLVNGWHRTAAAAEAGLKTLPALVCEYPDRWRAFEEAVWIANRGELSLRPGEKGRAVDRVLRQFPGTGDRELGRRLGVSHVYVWKRRRKLWQPSPAPRDPRREGASGLLRGLRRLFDGSPLRDGATGGDAREAAAEALAECACRQCSEDAGLWLQELEEIAHASWLRVAAGETGPPAAHRHGGR